MTTNDEPNTTNLTIKHRSSPEWCRVLLSAIEVEERRLQLEDLGEVKLRSMDETLFAHERTKILCGSGIAWARSNLKFPAGIVVTIFSIDGQLSSEHERGVCKVVALAIAQNLNKVIDPALLITSEWVETTMD
jgi:hypothetical protein